MSSTIDWKRCDHLFAIVVVVWLASLSYIKWLYECGFICGSSILFHCSTCLFFRNHMLLLPWLCSITWNTGRGTSSCSFIVQGCFGSLGSFVFPYETEGYSSNFCKELHCNFVVNSIESANCFLSDGHVHNTNLSHPWTWEIFLSFVIFLSFLFQCLNVFILQIFNFLG